MKFELPKLNFSFDALEPYMDAKTVEIHYTKHHQAYLDKFNAVLEKNPKINYSSAEDILKNLEDLPVSEEDRIIIKNQGGGYVNHNIFWSALGPKKEVDEKLSEEVKKEFGSIEKFREMFGKAYKFARSFHKPARGNPDSPRRMPWPQQSTTPKKRLRLV